MRASFLPGLLLALFLCILLCRCPAADAYSCGGGFFSLGATMDEVLAKCGEPTEANSWEDARPVSMPIYSTMYGFYSVVVNVPMDTWVYNLGPTKFMLTLTFERRTLVSVTKGGYGY